MQLTINGEILEFNAPMTVGELLDEMGLRGRFVAVERNRDVISFKKYDEVALENGDQIEIVTLVGGG